MYKKHKQDVANTKRHFSALSKALEKKKMGDLHKHMTALGKLKK